MKNLPSLRQALLLIVAATALFAAGCAKDRSVVTEKNNGISKPVKDPEPTDQKYGAVKGYVIPADAMAIVSLTDPYDGSYYSVPADNTGFFDLDKIPAGIYILDAVPTNRNYESVQFDVRVTGGNTTLLKISLPRK